MASLIEKNQQTRSCPYGGQGWKSNRTLNSFQRSGCGTVCSVRKYKVPSSSTIFCRQMRVHVLVFLTYWCLHDHRRAMRTWSRCALLKGGTCSPALASVARALCHYFLTQLRACKARWACRASSHLPAKHQKTRSLPV